KRPAPACNRKPAAPRRAIASLPRKFHCLPAAGQAGQTADRSARQFPHVHVLRGRLGARGIFPVPAYIDECQKFSSYVLIEMLSEVRKQGIALVLLNHYTSEISPELRNSLF